MRDNKTSGDILNTREDIQMDNKNIDLQLLNTLAHARALTRRGGEGDDRKNGGEPHRPEGAKHRGKGRGFGRILDLLKEKDGVSQQYLADRLGVRPQSVSQAVNTLAERGLVKKEADGKDKRASLIFITVEGIAHRKQRAGDRLRRAERAFSCLKEEEKETLLGLLKKIGRHSERGEGI